MYRDTRTVPIDGLLHQAFLTLGYAEIARHEGLVTLEARRLNTAADYAEFREEQRLRQIKAARST